MPNVPYVEGEVPEMAGEGESEAMNDCSKKEIMYTYDNNNYITA
jgi:hypothetical protein